MKTQIRTFTGSGAFESDATTAATSPAEEWIDQHASATVKSVSTTLTAAVVPAQPQPHQWFVVALTVVLESADNAVP
jgi:hypothetical protein